MSQVRLLTEKRFLPFFCTQFLGAFNDNVFKTALVTLVTFRAGQLTRLDGKLLAALLPGLFILPFFLFSATAGQLADKLDKAVLARAVKVFEIAVMVLAGWGFLASALWPLVAALFLMGVHSTVFGPVKYAYLPQHLRHEELVGGNGLIEMGTFVAILLGEILGAWLATAGRGGALTAGVVVGVAVVGYLVSRGIPRSPAGDPGLRIGWNPVTETAGNLRFARGNRVVWLSLLGISWFWFYGATLLAQFPAYAREVLGGDETVFILLLTVFSFGVGLGSLLCERLSGHKVEIGLVPFGALGLTLFGLDLARFAPAPPAAGAAHGFLAFAAAPAHWRGLADVALLGVFGGFYIVPLYALVQTRSERSHQSRVIAANNILNAAFMVGSALLSALLLRAGLGLRQLFAALAVVNAAVAVYIYALVPEFLLRFLAWALVHTVYRLDVRGVEHVPEQGPALLVSNNVSLVDVLVISAACRRPIRFVVDRRYFRMPVVGFFLRQGKAIPTADPGVDDALRAAAAEEAVRALAAGDLVGLFPEGRLTETGEVGPFDGEAERILARQPAPVVPLALRGLWGSFFSRRGGPAMTRPFRRGAFSRLELHAAAPVPAVEATAEHLRAQVLALRGERR